MNGPFGTPDLITWAVRHPDDQASGPEWRYPQLAEEAGADELSLTSVQNWRVRPLLQHRAEGALADAAHQRVVRRVRRVVRAAVRLSKDGTLLRREQHPGHR